MEFYVLVKGSTVYAEDDTPCPGPTKKLGTLAELPKVGEELVYIDENGVTVNTDETVKEVCSEDDISYFLFTTKGDYELIWFFQKDT